MYKLTIVSGPQRGSSFAIQEGENTIGRMSGNTVVIQSARVSKRHCLLLVEQNSITVKDLGSSNGTFVNGILTRAKEVKVGDRISVGEYVFQIDNPSARPLQRAPSARLSDIQPLSSPANGFPAVANQPGLSPAPSAPGAGIGISQPLAPPVPQDLPKKTLWYFDHRIMPFFYSIMLKNEWRIITASLFGIFILATVVIALYPLIAANEAQLIREAGKRAHFIARQIAESNAPALAAQASTKTDIGIAEKGDGVRVALLIDNDNRILAPPHRHGQYLTQGPEAIRAVWMRGLFDQGREKGWTGQDSADSSSVIAIEPVMVFDNRVGRNVVRGMGLVSIDITQSLPGSGETGIIYSQTLLIAVIIGLLIFMVIYRLTLRPFLVLNDDMDKVLKGDLPQVTHEYKLSELDSLWEIINSALQRMPKAGASSAAQPTESSPAAEDFSGAAHMMGDLAKFGVILCNADRKITYLNSLFEEISGIREEAAINQLFGTVARDQSLAVFANDLMDRSSGGDIVIEDYDFSGLFYKVHAVALGAQSGQAKGFLFLVVRTEG